MNTIAGISFERPVLGKPNYVRIDMNRYGEELKPFFKKSVLILPQHNRFPKAV